MTDSDPVLAQQRYTLQRTRDDGETSLRPALMIRPFGPVRMKFNILNFILTAFSGPILLGNPGMERR